MHLNKLLLEVRPSPSSKVAALVCRSSRPGSIKSPVHQREGEGKPPGQEQSNLREVWFRAGSTEQEGESSGGSVGGRETCDVAVWLRMAVHPECHVLFLLDWCVVDVW